MANAVGGYPSPSTWVEFDRPLELERCFSSKLEDRILDFAGCAIVISHDRWFLDRIATHIHAFERNSHVEWLEGNFEDYENDNKRRLGAEAVEPHRLKYKPLKVA